jgi:tRNA(fMet)-specific endonuclease VapC
MPEALLDTDTLSLLRRRHPQVIVHARAYLHRYGRLTFSELTRYEVVRGYKKVGATRQLAAFERFCRQHRVLPLDWRALEQAAEIWAELSRKGELIGEVDILLAGTALAHRLAVVTHNTTHFQRIQGLLVLDWTA